MKMVPFVDLTKQNKKIYRQVRKKIKNFVVNSDYILGKELKEFEVNLADYLSVKYAIGVANGTDAIEIALRSLDIPKNSEILIQGNTFIATAIAAIRAGFKIKLVDIDSETLQVDVNKIEEAINAKSSVVLPVHLFGMLPDMNTLLKLCEKNNLPMIEDVAQSIGARYADKFAGSFGVVSTTSFYPGKNLGGWGDGGAIFTDSLKIDSRCREIRNYGSQIKYLHPSFGFNSRLDDLQAIILDLKLKHLDQMNNDRNKISEEYNNCFYDLEVKEKVKIVKITKDSIPARHLYPIIINGNRDILINKMEQAGVKCMIHYPTPLSEIEWLKPYCVNRPLPVASSMSNKIISLPLFPGMSRKQVDKVKNIFTELVSEL
jgi:dTDP-4-amino-4,6-dideoxygalactose transaminase